MADNKKPSKKQPASVTGYDAMLSGVVELLEQGRRTSARAVNTIMTATYWEIGRRIVEHEQSGKSKADYGKQIIDLLATDLTAKLGRGFGRSNIFQMRQFYSYYPNIVQTASAQSDEQIIQTVSGQFAVMRLPLASRFRGRTTLDSSQWTVQTPASFMRPKRYVAAGLFVSSTARFHAFLRTNGSFPQQGSHVEKG